MYAPTNAAAGSRLPVYFFIQGGGFNSLSNANYDGSGLISAAEHEIVVVTFNYRVGPYGFIASREISESPSATVNNGLRDQRKALEWVQSYISLFGGDPDHVVLGGDSAGAASIALHLTAFGGRDDGLFQGAAAESVSFATILTVEESQYQYDNLVERTGCAGSATANSGANTLSCLRSKTAKEIQAQNKNIPYPKSQGAPLFMWNPVLDDDLIQYYTYDAFAHGDFIKVPVIFGDDTNGGTVFTPRGTGTQAQSNRFLQDQFPYLTTNHLGRINSLFPNRGPEFPNSGPFWRQVSDAYGDLRYMCPNLFISTAFARHGNAKQNWNYRFNVRDPALTEQGLGVPHTMEIAAIWGPENVHGGCPGSFRPGAANSWIVPFIQGYWTSFIRSLDPNVHRQQGTPEWKPFTSVAGSAVDEQNTALNRFLFDTSSSSGMETVDAAKRSACQYFSSIGVDIRQ